MSVIDTIKGTTPKDILKTATIGGALAGVAGLGTLIDKHVFNHTLGFKSAPAATPMQYFVVQPWDFFWPTFSLLQRNEQQRG